MRLDDLPPFGDELVLIVMGPGKGESILVRWPPDCWFVVDSFRRTHGAQEVHPAADALATFGGLADAVALTHPHDDHTAGLATLIDRRKPGGVVGWWPEDASPRWTTANAAQANRNGANEQAVAAIARVWREEPASRWELRAGADPLQIADATIRVLTPLPEAIAHSRTVTEPDYNEMSSAMVIDWHGCRLLLGADLVNRRGWEALEGLHGPFSFATSAAMKVAHHGSKEAQHAVALGNPPPTERTYIATPYNRGKKVPDFRDGEDVELLLAVMQRLLMSSHHGTTPADAATADTPRGVLRPQTLTAGPLTVDLDRTTLNLHDCWVATRWSSDGTLLSIERGQGSVSIVP